MRGRQDGSLKPRTVDLAVALLEAAVDQENESTRAEFVRVEFMTAAMTDYNHAVAERSQNNRSNTRLRLKKLLVLVSFFI